MTPHEHEPDDAPGRPGASSRHDHGPGHSHGLVDREILRSQAAVRVVMWSLLVLAVTAVFQGLVLASVASVALLAELLHNAGDALTAVPLGVAFRMRSARAERIRNAT
ncbi:MAG: cation diffusion facilitator family transporter, partial [Actinomycetes bacterium]